MLSVNVKRQAEVLNTHNAKVSYERIARAIDASARPIPEALRNQQDYSATAFT